MGKDTVSREVGCVLLLKGSSLEPLTFQGIEKTVSGGKGYAASV